MKDESFIALAVHALRQHRWCGDTYPEDGWPDVNAALAQYALERRSKRRGYSGARGDPRKVLELVKRWLAELPDDTDDFYLDFEIEPLKL